MFCNQCEQVSKGYACTARGVCGKDADVQSLQETLLYGVKGMAAYAHHARRLGVVDESVNAFIEEALFATVTNVNFDLQSLLGLVLECGAKNLRTLQMLDEGHTKTFGTPSPTTVFEGTRAGPGILVTGHDLVDLKDLLEQTQGSGINVYTHGEMLPAHGYPELEKYSHLVGHYGIRDEELGTIEIPGAGAVPRLIDMGQCNDSFGAIQLAVAMADALGCSVNDLPLSIVLSWFEQKAVAVLLTLLHLGVRGIRIGPAAPAFISPNVMSLLADKLDLGLIGEDPAADVRQAMA